MTLGARLDGVLDVATTPASLARRMREAMVSHAAADPAESPVLLLDVAGDRLAALLLGGAEDRGIAAELLCIDGLATAAFEIGADGDLDALGRLADQQVARIAGMVRAAEDEA